MRRPPGARVAPALSLVLALALAGCGQPGEPGATTAPPDTSSSPVPTSTFVPGPSASYMGVVLEGDLVVGDDGCIRLVSPAGTTNLVWPAGSEGRGASAGEVEVVLVDGTVFASTGTSVVAVGGLTDRFTEQSACLEGGPVLEVQDVRPAV